MISIAEIHPMLVHFPIVLWLCSEAIAVVVLLRGGDLSDARQRWPAMALYSLIAGLLMAYVAAIFGDMALDHAVAAGFAIAPLETHETAASITIGIFTLHAVLRLLAVWRKYPLTGLRGWLMEIPGLVGIAGLLLTAYLGGELVYHLGVNIDAMMH